MEQNYQGHIMKNNNFENKFKIIVDGFSKVSWNELIMSFSNSTVNHSWDFNHAKSNEISTLILTLNNEIICASIVRIYKIKYLNYGLAYLGSGPLLKNDNYLEIMLLALKEEYCENRNLYLRVAPRIYRIEIEVNTFLIDIFKKLNAKLIVNEDKTLFLDLGQTEGDIRKNLHQKWRNLLNKGEKYNFTIKIGTDDELFQKFKVLYLEMVQRKRYKGAINIFEIENIQQNLPTELKYTVIILELNDKLLSGGIFSTVGDTAIYFLGATNDDGKKNCASYVLQWEIIKWFKQKEFKKYDLGGCNPIKVPETYHFKAGICGKNHIIYSNIGYIDLYSNKFSYFLFHLYLLVNRIIKHLNIKF
jgi:lipid II:glycine glycyltransferase (peptidoglycan interpeptide bridge formation enzyme)